MKVWPSTRCILIEEEKKRSRKTTGSLSFWDYVVVASGQCYGVRPGSDCVKGVTAATFPVSWCQRKKSCVAVTS